MQLKKVRLRTTFASADTSFDHVKLACCEHYANVLYEYSNSELKAVSGGRAVHCMCVCVRVSPSQSVCWCVCEWECCSAWTEVISLSSLKFHSQGEASCYTVQPLRFSFIHTPGLRVSCARIPLLISCSPLSPGAEVHHTTTGDGMNESQMLVFGNRHWPLYVSLSHT